MNPQEYIDFSKQPKELINNVSFDSSRLWIDRKEYSSVIPLGGASQFGHQSASNVVSDSNLNRNLVYHISDPERYMDGEDLYMRCNFKGVCTDNSVPAVKLASCLDVGGIYSCFEEIKVEMGNRTIELINEADKLNAALSLIRDDPNYVDYNLMDRADSVSDFYHSSRKQINYKDPNRNLVFPYDFTINADDGDVYAAAGTLTLTNNPVPAFNNGQLVVGDVIEITTTKGRIHYAKVSAIGGAAVITIDANSRGTFNNVENKFVANSDIGNINRIRILGDNAYENLLSSGMNSSRSRIMNQGDEAVRLTFKLNLESLRQMRYVPLRFLKAPLKITIRMKEAPLAIVLSSPSLAADTNKIGYMFNECELVVPMLTVNPKQIEIDQALVKSEGLKFHYLTYEHHQKEFARDATTVNLTFQTNLSSVRYALFAITDVSLANSNTTNSQAHFCNSTFYKNYLKQFRYQVGTERFPAYNDVDVDEIFGSEALMLTRQTLNMRGHKEGGMRIEPWEYQDRDSDKFVAAVPFTKDDSPWSGVNLSLNYLELKMLFAGTPYKLANGALLHCWLAHDSLISITDQGVEVIS